MDDAALIAELRAARQLARQGRGREALSALDRLRTARPDHAEAALAFARQAAALGESALALAALERATVAQPAHETLAVERAVALADGDGLPAAVRALREFTALHPDSPLAWLLLGEMLEDSGSAQDAALARFEAMSRAQRVGAWRTPAGTPPHLLPTVQRAVASLRAHRRHVFERVLQPLRSAHPVQALARTDLALKTYLGEAECVPPDPMQRPRFLYVPGLPAQPFMDPALQPWAPTLRDAFPVIRDEALSVLREDSGLEDFVQVRAGDRMENYLGGIAPAWEAFFFYRHGERYDSNHLRCPRTSAVLESLDLCRIPGQTPEICFSVLAAGTHILPHYGVSNARAVMHLPLVVPPGCALNLVERGQHEWREGELLLFDDTYLHEAWNRSTTPRVILLMDCWNPHLNAAERDCVCLVSEVIGVLDVALSPKVWPDADGPRSA